MRRFAAPAATLLVFILVIAVWFVWLRPPPEAEGDARQDGLYGQVVAVRQERAPLLERFGEWVEAARSLESETRYDREGRVLELTRYRADNTVDYRVRYRYEGGNLVEEASFSAEDAPLYKWLHAYDREGREVSLTGYDEAGRLDFKTVYSYDDAGRRVRETSYAPDETVSAVAELSYEGEGYTRETRYAASALEAEYRTVERYDARGNRVEEAAYGVDGALQYRVGYRYDEAGRLLEETAYRADGSPEYRLENRYDAAGNLVEATEYDADGEPFYHYAYAYDDRGNPTRRETRGSSGEATVLSYGYDYDEAGNWVTRRTFKEVERFGETVLEPSEVTWRTLRYADEPGLGASGD